MVRLGLPLAVAVVLGAGCGSRGSGSADGTLYVSQCKGDQPFGAAGAPAAFSLAPDYFVANPSTDGTPGHLNNRLVLRFQHGGERHELSDALMMTIASTNQVGKLMGAPIVVNGTSIVRATLILRKTCPETPVALDLDGSIMLSAFGAATGGAAIADSFRINFDDRIAGTFDFTFVDRRSQRLGGVGIVPPEPQIGGTLRGDFDLIVDSYEASHATP